MKKHLPILIAAAAGLAAGPVLAAPTAEQLAGSYQVGGVITYWKADDKSSTEHGELDDGTGFGLDFGHRFSETWGARLRYEALDINRPDNFVSKHGRSFGIDALFYPTTEAYFAIGPRRVELMENHNELNVGMGYNFFIGDHFSISPEVNWLTGAYTNITAGVGFNYHFGLKEPVKAEPAPVVVAAAVVAAPKDSDNDGVIDEKDLCPETPAGDKVDANGCTIFAEAKHNERLEVLFANDSAVIPENSYGDIARVAEFLKKYPHVDVTIEGHTSAPGSDAHNKKLSQKRADAVAAALTTRYGISAERIKAIGYGEERLLTKETTKAAHALNRRVVAVLEVSERYRVQK